MTNSNSKKWHQALACEQKSAYWCIKICFHTSFISTCSKIEIIIEDTHSIQCLFFPSVSKPSYEWFINAWLLKQKKNREKTCFKVPWRPFQSAVYLTHCGVRELTYCSIVMCMPLTLQAECFIFLFRCQPMLLKSLFSSSQQCPRVCL